MRASPRTIRGGLVEAGAFLGGVVLLAPACSSFDMFADYADRGRMFKDEVRRLAEQDAGARVN